MVFRDIWSQKTAVGVQADVATGHLEAADGLHKQYNLRRRQIRNIINELS